MAETLNHTLDDMGQRLNALIDRVNSAQEADTQDNAVRCPPSLCESGDHCTAHGPNRVPLADSFIRACPHPAPSLQVAQIVQILNAHLTSLQWIDQNASSLQLRVQELSSKNQALRSDKRS